MDLLAICSQTAPALISRRTAPVVVATGIMRNQALAFDLEVAWIGLVGRDIDEGAQFAGDAPDMHTLGNGQLFGECSLGGDDAGSHLVGSALSWVRLLLVCAALATTVLPLPAAAVEGLVVLAGWP